MTEPKRRIAPAADAGKPMKKKHLKANKVKTAFTMFKAVGVGICEGFIPFAVLKGAEMPFLYGVPLIPVVIYLVIRMTRDLKGWYENDAAL